MAHIIGFTTISLVCLFTLFLTLRNPDIKIVLFVALIVRIIFLLINNYVSPLPDSTADAETFEIVAWRLSQNGFLGLMDYYKGPDPQFISWLIAIPYSLIGRSMIMAQSISLFFGICCVFLGWK